MHTSIVAHEDTSLTARVVSRTPLLYTAGPDESLDRPAHVRAGSGLARIGGRVAVIQDDANFIAIVDQEKNRVDSITLPAGEGGLRQFDDLRGNKRFKLDLEACSALPDDRLIAFASGSKEFRRWIVLMQSLEDGTFSTTMYDAASLYALLRSCREFAGSELNIEGAIFVDGRIRLFGRGNGSRADGNEPVNATCDLDWKKLEEYLLSGCAIEPPAPTDPQRYDLGEIDRIALGFTEAEEDGGRVYFTAAAEDSPDASLDGAVTGSALGILDSNGEARWTRVVDGDGRRFDGKIEGLLIEPGVAWGVMDNDDPRVPSELCRIELTGEWVKGVK